MHQETELKPLFRSQDLSRIRRLSLIGERAEDRPLLSFIDEIAALSDL
jgi:hypothetical protein